MTFYSTSLEVLVTLTLGVVLSAHYFQPGSRHRHAAFWEWFTGSILLLSTIAVIIGLNVLAGTFSPSRGLQALLIWAVALQLVALVLAVAPEAKLDEISTKASLLSKRAAPFNRWDHPIWTVVGLALLMIMAIVLLIVAAAALVARLSVPR